MRTFARDDERRPRLVDKDRVRLVHHAEVVRPLHHVLHRQRQVVTEEIEPQFLVGHVRHVAGVGGAALGLLLVRLHNPDGQAQGTEHLAAHVCTEEKRFRGV